MSTAEERVKAGMEELDRRVPNWRDCVRDRVIISSPSRCVLAQIFGGYSTGMHKLGWSNQDAFRFGVIATIKGPVTTSELSDAWNNLLPPPATPETNPDLFDFRLLPKRGQVVS